MSDGDYRQQQELEEERVERTIEAIRRVDNGTATHDDAEFLAAELGVKPYIREVA